MANIVSKGRCPHGHLFVVSMEKIVRSIKKRPFNLISMVTVSILYVLNNKVVKPNTTGLSHVFFVSFFNDLICPLWFLAYVNLLMITNDKEILELKKLLLICLGAGLVWEFVAPFLKKGSVTDPWDLVCYAIGTIVYWIILKGVAKKQL